MADDDAPVVDPGTPDNSAPDATQATDDAPTSDATTEPVAAPADQTTLEAPPEGETAPVADWPDDWRDKLAKGDAKVRKRLDRLKSPLDVMNSWQSLERKLSSGETKATLPDDATEEQVTAYRKDNGIPETPDGYLENLPNGLVIGDDDKPLMDSYLADVHGINADPAVVAKSLDWYYDQQEKIASAQAASDKEYAANGVDELRMEWGAEFRGNLDFAKSFLGTGPTSDDGTPLKDNLLGARLADGSLFGDNPDALRWLVKLANDANPAGFVTPSAGGSQAGHVEDEISSIEKVMMENRTAYNKDTKMQARYLKLLNAQEKFGAA